MNAAETSNNHSNDGSNPAGASGGHDETPETGDSQGSFECNICLDNAKDAVVSMCGHLFCWPCLNQWLEMRPNRKVCPVCKSAISKEKVVPIYGRNNESKQDPRDKLPPRPQGQRTEPENQGFQGFPGFGFGDGGFQMSFGIGAFPFGLFTSTFNVNDGRPQAPTPGTPQHAEEQFLSKMFLWVAILFLVWLLIA